MAGHMVTPYDLYATRLRARKKKDEKLLLASLDDKTTIDLLDVIKDHLTTVDPVETGDGTRSTRCLAVERHGDFVQMAFASDHVGEREVVHDGTDDARPALFEKRRGDITRYFSVALLWRPADGDSGILLIHSPWGRGGNKGHIQTLLQRALASESVAKAKLHVNPKIPESVLRRILSNAKATRITYLRDTGVTSEFDNTSGKKSAPAEMALVIRGSGSIPFRDALTAALRTVHDRERFFTIEVLGDNGTYQEETFDDVEVDVQTSGGPKRYSLRRETFPTLGFDYTSEINEVYWGLPVGDYPKWPHGLLAGTRKMLERVLGEVRVE